MAQVQAVSVSEPMTERTRAIFAATVGQFFELYDFAIYGFFAVEIGRSFFPSSDPLTSLLGAFATYGVGSNAGGLRVTGAKQLETEASRDLRSEFSRQSNGIRGFKRRTSSSTSNSWRERRSDRRRRQRGERAVVAQSRHAVR
jgi:hypothetical protein